MWALSSVTRDQTHIPCIGNTNTSPGKSPQIEIVQGKHHSDLICASS